MLTQSKYIYKYIYRLRNIYRVVYINIYRFKRQVVKLSPGKSSHFQENSGKNITFLRLKSGKNTQFLVKFLKN